MMQAPDGDLYIDTCAEDQKFGDMFRIEKSGGAITRNPDLVKALGDLFCAMQKGERHE